MVFGLIIEQFEAEGRETCKFLGVFRLSEKIGFEAEGRETV